MIEWVRNTRVGDHRTRDVIASIPNDAARVVQRRPIGDTYQEALEILSARARSRGWTMKTYAITATLDGEEPVTLPTRYPSRIAARSYFTGREWDYDHAADTYTRRDDPAVYEVVEAPGPPLAERTPDGLVVSRADDEPDEVTF